VTGADQDLDIDFPGPALRRSATFSRRAACYVGKVLRSTALEMSVRGKVTLINQHSSLKRCTKVPPIFQVLRAATACTVCYPGTPTPPSDRSLGSVRVEILYGHQVGEFQLFQDRAMASLQCYMK